ncbi:MAG: AmmeMemoRadiSam system protein B [Elusimicrobiota bacterium]
MKKIIQLLFILFIFSISTLPVFGEKSRELSIVSGVVPHHLLAKEIIEDFFESVAGQEQHPETIILLSPDHFNCSALEKDYSFISINWETDNIKLDGISADHKLLKGLSLSNNIIPNYNAVLTEFGITNLLPFIKKYLPETKIIPVLIPGNISREQLNHLTSTIDMFAPANTLLVASVDFSHYLPAAAAEFHDAKSIRVLLNFEENEFENIEVDSWQSLYAVRLFAKLRKSEKPIIIAHKNSVDFLPCDFNSTTSYFSVVFQKGKENKYIKTETVLLAGDMMLDRGMEELMKQNSVYYPFQKIVQLLRGVDIVFANLEGPLVENPPEFTGAELKFSFHPDVLEGVKWSQINLLSIANNHIYDMGKEGLKETKSWLQEYRINFVGSPFSGSIDKNNNPAYSEQSVFLSFNRVLPYIDYQREIIKEVQKVRQSNPGKFIIVSMHWGNEYELTSSYAQRELACKVIASGADVIVGHHPHVVQEIELIQDKPVFYSLGNFIFDQPFMPETKEGLAVGLTISSDKLTFRLFPIKNQKGQPILMSQKEAELFLKNLAEKSDRRLWENIKKGMIELELVD